MNDSRVRPMIDRLTHRGDDHTGTWHSEFVGLGQCSRWTTRESKRIALPLHHSGSDLTLVADARIDNREDLIRLLGDEPHVDNSASDEELILQAYTRWGARAPARLLGDFSFAIWDERNGQLFCARDFAGVRPFYFAHLPGEFFAFGSEIKALLAEKDIPTDINHERVADFLTHITFDHSYTFYKRIDRLPAGHTLIVNKNGVRIERYFNYDPSNELHLSSDDEYAESFKEIFTEAVKARMRSRGPVATTLSGGLDSSSIAAVAARHSESDVNPPIHTFSAVFDAVSECDEREYVNVLLDSIDVTPHFFPGDQHHPIGALSEMLSFQDEPFTAPNAAMLWQLYREIGNVGFGVLLSGHGGDETVSQGYGYLSELAQAHRWVALYRELSALKHVSDRSAFRSLCVHMYNANRIRASRNLSARIQRKVLGRYIHRSASSDLYRDLSHPVHLLSSDLRSRTHFDERFREWKNRYASPISTERAHHVRILEDPFQQIALEVLDRQAAANGINVRFPFWDRRLAEYCLSLPPTLKLKRGMDRYVLRASMKGILPRTIQRRTIKTDFTPNLLHGIRHNDRQLVNSVRDTILESQDILNTTAVQPILDRLMSHSANPIEMGVLLNIFSFAYWQKNINPSYP